MVLGLRTKNRGNPSVQVDYLIHIQEIKPWPPSQSLISLQAVFIQWEKGDSKSGSTKSVVPTLGSVVGEGKVDFNESFRLSLTLLRDISSKNLDADTFQKNCLEFNLYEAKKDKTVKGQLLAFATVNFADFGVMKEAISVSIPMTCKRSAKNMAEPFLCLRIQPAEMACPSSSSRGASLKNNGSLSVSAFGNDEYSDEAEIASFTDDSISSHSSLTLVSSAFESYSDTRHNEEDELEAMTSGSMEGSKRKHTLASRLGLDISNMHQNASHGKWKANSSHSSLMDLSSDTSSPQSSHAPKAKSSCSSSVSEGKDVDFASYLSSPSESSHNRNEYLESGDSHGLRSNGPNSKKAEKIDRNFPDDTAGTDNNISSRLQNKDGEEQELEIGRLRLEELFKKDKLSNQLDSTGKQVPEGSGTYSLRKKNTSITGISRSSDNLYHTTSFQSPLDSSKSNGLPTDGYHQDVKDINVISDLQNGTGNLRSDGGNYVKVSPKDKSPDLESKIWQLENRLTRLEAELRQTATIEAALYSVAAEHGNSMSKVHTPARRLARLYLHAFEEDDKFQRASAAKGAISGLVLVAKACGSDVPRLTFWLSNTVVLRAVISQAFEELHLPMSGCVSSAERSSSRIEYDEIPSPPKCQFSSSGGKENKNAVLESLKSLEDPYMFTTALEKLEAWIFSRIIESIWWQVVIPHMQSATVNADDEGVSCRCKKSYERISSTCDQDQGNFSLNLWKNAFKDALKRLCPVRAGGHECGCLPMLVKLVMEQCVTRLDVAMFNAILRESVDKMPTDPVFDPISDAKVLPIPVGISSFAAGAQLKTMIGNWSRFLTDLVGLEDDDGDSHEDGIENDEIDEQQNECSQYFPLLGALSEIMMLPKDFLLSRSIRKEVCPNIGAPLIKRVLDVFVPDEFCPDPIPDVVFEALASEDPYEAGEECIVEFPCTMSPPQYSPPSPACIVDIIKGVESGLQMKRSESSILGTSFSSDYELKELSSPLGMILLNDFNTSVETKSNWLSKWCGDQYDVKHEFLHHIWFNSE